MNLRTKSSGRAGHRWRQLRTQTLNRDNHTCRLQLDGCTTHATTVDHITPRSKAPHLAEHPDNLIAACHTCNTRKGNLTLTEATRRYRTTPATGTKNW